MEKANLNFQDLSQKYQIDISNLTEQRTLIKNELNSEKQRFTKTLEELSSQLETKSTDFHKLEKYLNDMQCDRKDEIKQFELEIEQYKIDLDAANVKLNAAMNDIKDKQETRVKENAEAVANIEGFYFFFKTLFYRKPAIK